MDAKVSLYFYIETTAKGDFSTARKPVVFSKVAREHKEESYKIFKECGGIKIVDYFKNSKTHIRMSFWQSADGYARWQGHQNNVAYLKQRATYLAENNIIEMLEGPFAAVQNE